MVAPAAAQAAGSMVAPAQATSQPGPELQHQLGLSFQVGLRLELNQILLDCSYYDSIWRGGSFSLAKASPGMRFRGPERGLLSDSVRAPNQLSFKN